jgi:hypothetical protein
MHTRNLLMILLAVTAFFERSPSALAQGDAQRWPRQYMLLPGSELTDDCRVCGRPTIMVPMRGTFGLRLVQENPLVSTYAVENLAFTAGWINGPFYNITGKGTYTLGGEVTILQDMFLELVIDNQSVATAGRFTNDSRFLTRPWPSLEINLPQTNGTDLLTYTLKITAAPVREFWFSTANGFHPGIQLPHTDYVSPGDLISSTGRFVKRNAELTAGLGIMPLVPDLGLDAVTVLPGGEIAWSAERDIFSETLGALHHGDLLSNRGRIVRTYAEWIRPFSPEPPPADPGLDAVQVLDSGEVYFSIETNFWSETLSRAIRSGDLLSSHGYVVKSNEELIARFQPPDPKKDYGLDAIFVWPSGEVWFSVETGFYGPHFETYTRGDLLSDQGYVVYRNLDLLAAFAPVEDLADFGLDALFVITDATPTPPTPLRLMSPDLQLPSGEVTLRWEGKGRVYQCERTDNVEGPYVSVGPITTESVFTDFGALTNKPTGFYRVQQW